jgi:DNA-binding MarR family transcriptional regulator
VVSQPDNMQDQLAYIIASVSRRLDEELAEKLRPDGIPIEQLRILSALASQNGRSMGELAELVLVDAPTLTKIIDRMVNDALVYRGPSPNDRRRVLIFLATKGRAMHTRLSKIVRDQQRSIVARLDARGAEELKSLLVSLSKS